MNGSGATDTFFRWFPIAVAVVQLVFLPVLVVVLKDQIEKVLQHSSVLDAMISVQIKKHDENLYAHPALADLRKLEDNITNLSNEVRELGLKIERLTPRRRSDMVGGGGMEIG